MYFGLKLALVIALPTLLLLWFFKPQVIKNILYNQKFRDDFNWFVKKLPIFVVVGVGIIIFVLFDK